MAKDKSPETGGGVGANERPKPEQRFRQGKIKNKVHEREEEYAYVTPSDLHDVADFGTLEFTLGKAGDFFFAGALWAAVGILANQTSFAITAWLGVCGISMLFGIVLMIVSFIMFRMRQRKVKKYFPKETH